MKVFTNEFLEDNYLTQDDIINYCNTIKEWSDDFEKSKNKTLLIANSDVIFSHLILIHFPQYKVCITPISITIDKK